MSAAWATVLAVGAGTIVLKSVGPVGRPQGAAAAPRRLAVDGRPAILAALVVTETFASGRSLVVDARIAGVAAGACAIALRAPLWIVIVVGAGDRRRSAALLGEPLEQLVRRQVGERVHHEVRRPARSSPRVTAFGMPTT